MKIFHLRCCLYIPFDIKFQLEFKLIFPNYQMMNNFDKNYKQGH